MIIFYMICVKMIAFNPNGTILNVLHEKGDQMETKLKILEGRLTAYQLSEALGIPMETAQGLLNEELAIEQLDEAIKAKITVLESALFNQ